MDRDAEKPSGLKTRRETWVSPLAPEHPHAPQRDSMSPGVRVAAGGLAAATFSSRPELPRATWCHPVLCVLISPLPPTCSVSPGTWPGLPPAIAQTCEVRVEFHIPEVFPTLVAAAAWTWNQSGPHLPDTLLATLWSNLYKTSQNKLVTQRGESGGRKINRACLSQFLNFLNLRDVLFCLRDLTGP